jgi:hypothetical protein
MDSIEEKVLNFVARATKRAKVSFSSRLQYDLGLEGDDAVEFFRSFEKECNVDLQSLWSNWDQHFVAEGGPGWGFFVMCLVLFGFGVAIARMASWHPFWAWGILLVAFWIWPMRCWPFSGKKLTPITVHNLTKATRAGRWSASPEV